MKKLFSVVILITLLFTSCTQDLSEFDNSFDNTESLQIKLADFMVKGSEASLPNEDKLDEIKAYLFVNGKLSKKYEDLSTTGSINLKISEKKGNLYVVANGNRHKIDTKDEYNISEDEWLKHTTSQLNDLNSMYFVGMENLQKLWNEKRKKIFLKRGMARFDVIGLSETVKLNKISFANVSSKGYFFAQNSIQTPDVAEETTVTRTYPEPLQQNKQGICYLYEQIKGKLEIILELEVNGEKKTINAPLSSLTEIKRNAVYTLQLGESAGDISVSLDVSPWENGEDIILPPDFQSDITIDTNISSLPGATINEDKHGLEFVYQASEGILALSCENDLELQPIESDVITITPYKNAKGETESNKFKVIKRQLPPGREAISINLQFRRKGLTYIYKEDNLTLSFEPNPTKLTGILKFDAKTATCDFETYVENELGVFEVRPDKELVVSISDGEDKWIIAKQDENNAQKYRIIAGWKPNDPKADGRPQEAKIIIRDKNKSRGASLLNEEYIIRRRTKDGDLPVVNINGTWWCKYNLRGNVKNIKDQILTTDDPANGVNLAEYMSKLDGDNLLKVLGGQYQAGNYDELPLKYSQYNNTFYHEGYVENTKDFATLPETEMAPPGYRLPNKEDYIFFTSKTSPEDFNLGGANTSKSYTNKFEKDVQVRVYSNADVSFYGHRYSTINYYEFTYENEKLVLCGLGHQWGTSNGDIAWNKIILATYGTKGRSWYIEGYTWEEKPKGENWLKFPEHNTVKTRAIRCIKSEVLEYIY